MEYHKLLKMQMRKCHFNDESLPSDLSLWKSFVQSVNKSYISDDNDRYLLDRSMHLSSSEMKKLNGMLENAQKIARMAYWSDDVTTQKITWSKQAYFLFGVDDVDNMDAFYLLIEEKERIPFQEKIKISFTDHKEFECEIQIKHQKTNRSSTWYRVIGKPIFDVTTGKPVCMDFVAMDISSKKIAENKLHQLNNKLIISARRAGMADVATSILHNVGNILTSANVSLNLISEKINDPITQKLNAIKELIEKNKHHIGEYLSSDEKGKLVPSYLIALTGKIDQLHESIRTEVRNLTEQLQHIKDITAMQKDISGISDMNENIFVYDLIDTAIMMCDPSIESRSIKIVKEYKDNIFIHSDRSKILQILVNLIQNSKESLLSITDRREKTLTLMCHKINDNHIAICVSDNGLGMSPETLKKIYTFGFTTKKDGHGFGMHSSSLTAKELGGSLSGNSDGIDQGALFTLLLPMKKSKREVSHESSEHEFENHRN